MAHVINLIDPSRPVAWTHPLEAEAPRSERMVFYIVPLTEAVSRALGAAFPSTFERETGFSLSRDELMSEMFVKCVKKIENVLMPGETNRRTLQGEADVRAFLDVLPAAVSGPIFVAIQNTAVLNAGQAKNSDGSRDSGPFSEASVTGTDGTADSGITIDV